MLSVTTWLWPTPSQTLTSPIFTTTPKLTFSKTTGSKKRGRQGEGGGRPPKQQQTQSGQSISKQLQDGLIHGIPCDDNLPRAAIGLSKEDEGSIHEMRGDILEVARDADKKNSPISSCFPTFWTMCPLLIHYIRLPLHPAHTNRKYCWPFPYVWKHHIQCPYWHCSHFPILRQFEHQTLIDIQAVHQNQKCTVGTPRFSRWLGICYW